MFGKCGKSWLRAPLYSYIHTLPQPIRLASGTGLALLRLGAGPVVCRRVRAPAVVEEHLQSAVQQAGAPTRKYEAKPALHGPFEDTGAGAQDRQKAYRYLFFDRELIGNLRKCKCTATFA